MIFGEFFIIFFIIIIKLLGGIKEFEFRFLDVQFFVGGLIDGVIVSGKEAYDFFFGFGWFNCHFSLFFLLIGDHL